MTTALPAEPLPHALPAGWRRLALATRPAFLTITLAGCLLGVACGPVDGHNAPWLLLGLIAALAAHAGANVINDVADDQSGTDAANTARLFPFTGGSRFIQNGVLDRAAMRRLALGLFGFTLLAGLALLARGGWPLAAIGLTGVFIAWAYSMPPLALNSRGLGEAALALAFALVPVGMAAVGGGDLRHAGWAGAAYGALVAAILYANQFPDRAADLAAGKHHWVARLSPRRAAQAYPLFLLAGYGLPPLAVMLDALPPWTLAALLPLPLSLAAARDLVRFADRPAQLRPAIRYTLAAAHLHALLLALALAAHRLVGNP